MHVDLDCFYVQVERRKDPTLIGVPCAVVQYNAWKGGGIIALSYEAKAAGVKRSMRGEEARKLCPGIRLVTVPVKNKKADLTRYREAGSEVFRICGEFQGAVCQRTSIDEAYLDVTEAASEMLAASSAAAEATVGRRTSIDEACLDVMTEATETEERSSTSHSSSLLYRSMTDNAKRTFVVGIEENEIRSPLELLLRRCGGDASTHPDALLVAGAMQVARLRAAVKSSTGFTLSAGIASNKMLAKLISGTHKPNKQTVLPMEEVQPLLRRLPLRDLNGFGGKLGDFLIETHGIERVGDLQKYSHPELYAMTREGASSNARDKVARWMYDACRGVCDEVVEARLLTKSVGCGKTFRGPQMLRTMRQMTEYLRLLSK